MILIVLLWRYFYRSFILLRVRLGLAQAEAHQEALEQISSNFDWRDGRTLDGIKFSDAPPSYDEVMNGNYPIIEAEHDRLNTERYKYNNLYV